MKKALFLDKNDFEGDTELGAEDENKNRQVGRRCLVILDLGAYATAAGGNIPGCNVFFAYELVLLMTDMNFLARLIAQRGGIYMMIHFTHLRRRDEGKI
jgi:hypothetical protein